MVRRYLTRRRREGYFQRRFFFFSSVMPALEVLIHMPKITYFREN